MDNLGRVLPCLQDEHLLYLPSCFSAPHTPSGKGFSLNGLGENSYPIELTTVLTVVVSPENISFGRWVEGGVPLTLKSRSKLPADDSLFLFSSSFCINVFQKLSLDISQKNLISSLIF